MRPTNPPAKVSNTQTEPIPAALRESLLAPSTEAKEAAMPGLPARTRHKSGKAVPSVSRGGLTTRQKAVLCQMARTAYAILDEHGLIEAGTTLEEWRRAEQLAAVGVGSLRECRQAHYLRLRGHFEALAGRGDARAFADLTAPADDADRQTAWAALARELKRFAELPDADGRRMGEHRAEAYARTIAKSRGYVGPDALIAIRETWPVAKIWTLVYTLKNRVARKREGL
jgi:hypothetical protein